MRHDNKNYNTYMKIVMSDTSTKDWMLINTLAHTVNNINIGKIMVHDSVIHAAGADANKKNKSRNFSTGEDVLLL